MADGRIAAFGQDVKACALGQASASVLGRHVIGASREQIAGTRDALHAMLTAGGPAPGEPFAELEVLLPARDYRNRHASILLAWDATLAAFDEALAAAVRCRETRLTISPRSGPPRPDRREKDRRDPGVRR